MTTISHGLLACPQKYAVSFNTNNKLIFASEFGGRFSTLIRNDTTMSFLLHTQVDFCIVAEERDCYSEYQAACDMLWELCKSWNIPIR